MKTKMCPVGGGEANGMKKIPKSREDVGTYCRGREDRGKG